IGYSGIFFFFSSRRRHTSFSRDWSSDVCSSDLSAVEATGGRRRAARPLSGSARDAGRLRRIAVATTVPAASGAALAPAPGYPEPPATRTVTPMTTTPRIAFLASQTGDAQQAMAALVARQGQCEPDEADVLCPLGGDGFMLQTLHRYGSLGKPVFGMKLGTVGFLMNQYREDDLLERIDAAEPAVLRPLEMVAQT